MSQCLIHGWEAGGWARICYCKNTVVAQEAKAVFHRKAGTRHTESHLAPATRLGIVIHKAEGKKQLVYF